MTTATADSSLTETPLSSIAHELAHFSNAPQSFFLAWKRGVELAGVHLFGNGTRAGLEAATRVWDLCPNVPLIARALGPKSPSERKFLAALVSFYNSEDGGRFLKRAGFSGFADLSSLDLKRRAVLADLLLNYSGW